MYLGIDCGTQGTKALVFNPETGRVAGSGNAPHQIISNDDGRREQQPSWWVEALVKAVRAAVEKSGVKPEAIRGIGVSGQHHGLVMLGQDKRVLRAAKLWNDMETAGANGKIIAEAGGVAALAKRLGTSLPVGYTASKVRWMLENEPELWKLTRHILLPHDYLNFWMTGRLVTEPGDASGTGFYHLVKRGWDLDMVRLIDPSGILEKALPEVIESDACVGPLTPEAARELGLAPGTLVCGGSGDNVMGAFGTGNVVDGDATLGLGTSGVLNIYSSAPLEGLDPVLQVFAAAGGGWLATVCVVNATSATTTVQQMFGMDLDAFTKALAASPVGAEGLRLHPFFNGERMPPLPTSRGLMTGMTSNNMKRENFIRATAEAVIFTIKWGYDRLMRKLPPPPQLRLTGGGANNPYWRRIIADVFNSDAVCLMHDEGGAFGAALLAMLMVQREKDGVKGTPAELCRKYVLLDETKRVAPNPENVRRYQEIYAKYDAERRDLYGA